MPKNIWNKLALTTLLVVIFVACSDKGTNSGGGGQEVRFELTPYTAKISTAKMAQSTITKRFEFHCIDQTNSECPTIMYITPADDGDWMGYPQDHSSCGSFFAVINHEGMEYTFVGTIQRAFREGSGPFVTGTYDGYDIANQTYEAGTFMFYEQQLVEGTSPVCPDQQ